MRTGAHTQGDWEARIYGGWDTPRIWSPSGSIALLQHFESGPAEGEANARLIAASPKMLAALRRLSMAALCRDNTMGDQCRLIEVKAELMDAMKHADEVIAKATGSGT